MLHYIFAGNPGVGKSTLLNSMAGKVAFKAGFSAGSGMTSRLDAEVVDGVAYLDTPGLNDTQKRKEAAAAIEQALKKDGLYKIVFVITLESGRVKPADIQTMQIVHKACPVIGKDYGIIINKVNPKILDKLNKSVDLVLRDLFVSLPPTVCVHLNPLDGDLEEQDDVLVKPPPALQDFLKAITTIRIEPKDVSELNVDDWDAKLESLESLIVQLEEDKNAQVEQMEQQAAAFQCQLEESKRRAEDAQEFFRQQMERSEENAAKRAREDREQFEELQEQHRQDQQEAREEQRHREMLAAQRMAEERKDREMRELMAREHQQSHQAMAQMMANMHRPHDLCCIM